MLALIDRWRARWRVRSLPQMRIHVISDFWMAPTTPNPTIRATLFDEKGAQIGRAAYGQDPRTNILMIYSLEIDQRRRRQGYGLAFLCRLHQASHLPMRPVKVVGAARGFWAKARRLNVLGMRIGEDMWPDVPSLPHTHPDGTFYEYARYSPPDPKSAHWLGEPVGTDTPVLR